MIAREIKRRTDKVHREMSEQTSLQGVNETLAHHAAWTEERFEQVEERLGGLELGQQNILEAIGGLTVRVGNLETAYVAMYAAMGRVEDRLCGKIDNLAVRVDKVLAFAVNDEPRLAEILKDQNE